MMNRHLEVADDFDVAGTPFYANNNTDTTSVVRSIDNGIAYGFQCAKVVQDNRATVTDVPLAFFLDISFPIGSEDVALLYLQEQLVSNVASYYGVSDGTRCDDPTYSLTGTTWLVQIFSQTTDWTRETLFDSCRQLKADSTTHECYVYKAVVTGSSLDTGFQAKMTDVLDFMQGIVESESTTDTSPFDVAFLGVPVLDPTLTGDTSRDNLGNAPSSVAEAQTAQAPPSDRQTVTIVGGLLVAAFGIAFIGIGLVLWRRRQDWLRRRRELQQLDLDQDKNHPTHPDDDEYYGEDQLHQDLYGGDEDEEGHGANDTGRGGSGGGGHLELDGQGRVRSSDSSLEGAFSSEEKITIDLGTTFKDQLMGVHGASSSNHHLNNSMNNSTNNNKRSFRASSALERLYGRGALSNDGASDVSDADSWAQTDGTIGSLENVNLEPITAEV